jgi:hypothetical protein
MPRSLERLFKWTAPLCGLSEFDLGNPSSTDASHELALSLKGQALCLASEENALADNHDQCGSCGATAGHIFKCPQRPKGTAPVEQVDCRIIEALIAVYSRNTKSKKNT